MHRSEVEHICLQHMHPIPFLLAQDATMIDHLSNNATTLFQVQSTLHVVQIATAGQAALSR
jgi:hypothetical protein